MQCAGGACASCSAAAAPATEGEELPEPAAKRVRFALDLGLDDDDGPPDEEAVEEPAGRSDDTPPMGFPLEVWRRVEVRHTAKSPHATFDLMAQDGARLRMQVTQHQAGGNMEVAKRWAARLCQHALLAGLPDRSAVTRLYAELRTLRSQMMKSAPKAVRTLEAAPAVQPANSKRGAGPSHSAAQRRRTDQGHLVANDRINQVRARVAARQAARADA